MADDQRAADVAVIGGGVMGCATAYYLSQAGARVVLLEQSRIGGAPSASGASAAIVEALAANPLPLARQAQLARRLLADLALHLLEVTGIDFEYQRLGTIRLAFSDLEAATLREGVAARYAALDVPTEWLDARALREHEPASPERVLGGLYIPSTNGLYAPKYVRALAAGAAAHGASIQQGVSVTGFDVQDSRVAAVRTSGGTVVAGQVVLATGAWTGIASNWLGRPLPIGPERGQIMALQPAPGEPRVAHVVHGPGGYIIPKANGTAVVGATHEDVGFDARVTLYGMKYLADLSYRLAPGLEGAALKHVWMGFRPITLGGGMPAVGKLPGLDNAYVAAGHGAIGVTVSAAVGLTLAQLMRGATPDLPLDAFEPPAAL
jgi:glycine oxidase